MTNYIPVDKLIAEIERYIKHYEKLNRDEFKNGELYICQELLSFIKSLQQEQQDVDLEKEIIDYWTATGWYQIMTLSKFKEIARHFLNLVKIK